MTLIESLYLIAIFIFHVTHLLLLRPLKEIFMSKLISFDAFLQSIQDYARNDYRYYIAKQVDSEPAIEALIRKNRAIWNTGLNASGRYKAYNRGESIAVQIVYAHRDGKSFTSLLLIKPGKDFDILAEGLPIRDMTLKHQRVTIFCYELIHDNVSWTWRMTPQEMNRINTWIENLARKHSIPLSVTQDDAGTYYTQVEKLQDQLYSRPGFRGIRKQVGILITKLREEWKKYRPNNSIKPTERTYLKYVKRIKRS